MKSIYMIILVFLFLNSCKAGNFKDEIIKAFSKKDYKRVEKLLDNYYQINGVDDFFELYYLKFAISKGNLKKIMTIYDNVKSISVKKDKGILNDISKLILKEAKNFDLRKRSSYFKMILKYFPYSESIYSEYLNTLIKLNDIDKAFKVYLAYDEIFNENDSYPEKIIFYKLKEIYEKNKKIKVIKLISELNLSQSNDYLRKILISDETKIFYIDKLPKNFDTDILKKLMISDKFSVRKKAFELFIKFGKKENVKNFISKIYPNLTSESLKVVILKTYYERFKILFDEKLLTNYLKLPEKRCESVKIIKELRLVKYKEYIKKFLGTPKDFICSPQKIFLLRTLADLDKKSAKDFIVKLKKDYGFKIKEILIDTGYRELDCSLCVKMLKDNNSNEEDRAWALKLLLKSKKDISFFKEYDNIIYYNILLENHKFLDNEVMEKIALSVLKKHKDERMFVLYLKRLSLKEIDSIFKSGKLDFIEDKYFLKIIYYSVVLEKTADKDGEFENFILKYGFHKDYIKLYRFHKRHINILLKLYVREHGDDKKLDITEKIINALNMS